MFKNKNTVRNDPLPRPPQGTRSPSSPFAIGDKVKYVGGDRELGRLYAGDLEICEFGTKFDTDKCTCLKPDGRTTSWIEYEDLKKLPKTNNSQ